MLRFARTGIHLLVLLAVGALLLSACNLPGQPTTSPAGAIYTAAAHTLEARLTQASQPLPTNILLTPQSSATPTPPITSPSQTPAPSASPSPIAACDQARFIQDISIPDDTELTTGAAFTKTWRVQNSGTCAWNTDYRLVLVSEDRLGAPANLALPKAVAPGETVDISMNLTAPSAPGTYRSEFQLSNPAGQKFGIGGPDKTIWVQIQVDLVRGMTFDFLSNANRADWKGGAPGGEEVILTFNAPGDETKGIAAIRDQVEMENGATSGKVLLTFPYHTRNGYVSGKYPAYTIQAGDHFLARLGFMLPDGQCGAGQVIYRLMIQDEGRVRTLQEWGKECNKRMLPVDVDLSAYKGKTVRFILEVEADGSFDGDWAIWNSARVEN